MIVNAILSLGSALVELISGALSPLSTAFSSYRASFSGWGSWVGDRVGPANQILPISTLFSLLDVTFSYVIPSMIVYSLAYWVYAHIPFLGKG